MWELAGRRRLGYRVRMAYRVIPIAEQHIEGFRAAVDAVARERIYLAVLEAYPLEEMRRFFQKSMGDGHPQFIALAGEQVIGWCFITPLQAALFTHSGLLAMGIIEDYRGQGIGEALMNAALDAAKAKGLTRIELTVREHNLRAKRLYEKMGFQFEGVKHRGVRADGIYEDLICMALLFDEK